MTPTPTRTAPCGVCGRPVAQRETHAGPHVGITWWQPDAHTAPCGAPCAAGGVSARTAAALADALAHAHRATSCGTPGCGGGWVLAAEPIAVADIAALDAATFRGDLGTEHYCEDCGALAGDCGPLCPNNDPWQHAEHP